MGHRHFNTFNMSGINQGLNHNYSSQEQSHVPMGGAVAPDNGSFACPMDNMLWCGAPSDSQWMSEGRANEHSSLNCNMEVQQLPPAFSGPFYDTYPHPSAAGNLYLAPGSNAGHMHSSYYNRQAIHGVEGGLLDPTTATGRGPFKRKSPGFSGARERGSTSRFSGAGSSSGSSQSLLERPTSDYQSIPSDHINLPPFRGNSFSISGEDSLRNVRSRSRLDFEPNITRTHLSSYPSHLYHPTPLPTNHSGTVGLGNLNTDVTGREWNPVPLSAAAHGSIPISDINGLNRERNRFLIGGRTADIGSCHPDSVSSGHPVSSSRYLQGPPAQTTRDIHNMHSRRTIPAYRTSLSYSPLGHEAAASHHGLHSYSESFSSRYTRPSSAAGWRNSYRNGRSRIAVERQQSLSSLVVPGSEAFMIADHSSSFGGSRTLFDQYRDMRLDVDSMSYEELLALGERIGSVNTGLSEDMISKCLMENVQCSMNQNHNEGTCAICLEEYNSAERVGTLKKCGHEYHVKCIRKWLLMKNACPICKSAALPE